MKITLGFILRRFGDYMVVGVEDSNYVVDRLAPRQRNAFHALAGNNRDPKKAIKVDIRSPLGTKQRMTVGSKITLLVDDKVVWQDIIQAVDPTIEAA